MKGKYDAVKPEKISEKAMLVRVVSMVSCVVLCLLAMVFGAYAHFSSNVTSGHSTIRSASFQPTVSVRLGDENGPELPITDGGQWTKVAQLEGNKTYCVLLQHDPNSTAETGFVIIEDSNGTRYHTQQLGRDGDGKTKTITFWLTPTADTVVTFRGHWGTSSYYSEYQSRGDQQSRYITDGEDFAMTILTPPTPQVGNGETIQAPDQNQDDTPATEEDTQSSTPATGEDSQNSTPATGEDPQSNTSVVQEDTP